MIEKVRNFIVHHNLFANGNKIVYVAVSGGIDSCVLLHILFNLHEEFDFELRIVHFNHNTRGMENLKDEEFVKNLAKDLNLKIAIGRNAKAALKMNEGILRAKRYEYFNTLLDKNENSLIATAHNSDDNIETFLMRLLRGSRLKGLVGIKPKRGNFIRPLLSVNRNQIESYAKENKIKFREDISNKDNSITRNLIRNKLIPSIETDFGDSLKKNILKVIEDLTQHYDLYSEQVQQAVKKTVKTSRYGVSLNKRS
jgi:tRNA(Ile)-lysidine synthase